MEYNTKCHYFILKFLLGKAIDRSSSPSPRQKPALHLPVLQSDPVGQQGGHVLDKTGLIHSSPMSNAHGIFSNNILPSDSGVKT